MGHKKRPATPKTRHSPPSVSVEEATVAPVAGSGLAATRGSEGSSYSEVKLECERALTALRKGNHTKSLRLLKESCARHGDCASHAALIFRVQGTVCMKVASMMDDHNTKQRYLKIAIDAVHRAVELSPTSIEFAHFYANLLYEAANDGKEYEEVMRVCDSALDIENPIDPAKESLQDENEQKINSAEGRIAHVQNEIRGLKQKASIASISTWMKNLGTGEEIRLIPIRRASEDPMEIRLVQTRRSNEIKKAAKTPEERRKEIEVRVAAARLLQQKPEMNQGKEDIERSGKALEALAGPDRRLDRRKYGNSRRNSMNLERKDQMESYWNSMSVDEKKSLLKIKTNAIKRYFGSSKDALASAILNEALSFFEQNKSWEFWLCYKCNEKFIDSESHMHHVVETHMGNLLPKLQTVLPQSVDSKWIDMMANCTWRPLDFSHAIKVVNRQNTGQDVACNSTGYSDCKDALDSPLEMGHLKNRYVSSILLSESIEGEPPMGHKNQGKGQLPLTSLVSTWPQLEDPERAKLLERIHDTFEVLTANKCLASSHVSKVMQFVMDGLQTLHSGSEILSHGFDQSPICICFLGASQLKKIYRFLTELSHACGFSRLSGKNGTGDGMKPGAHVFDVKEKITIDSGILSLHLDGCAYSYECGMDDNATSITSYFDQKQHADTDSLLSWIFGGLSSGEQLQSWMHMKEEKTCQGLEIFQSLEREFYQLQNLCERKCEHLRYEGALKAVDDLCVEEERKETLEQRDYDSILRNRREELSNVENDVFGSRFELDVISNILKEAEALHTNQFSLEDSYGELCLRLDDIEYGDDIVKGSDRFNRMDTCIKVVIQRQKDQLSIELSKIDARILKVVDMMQKVELKLVPMSGHDYRIILLALVKSYIRAHLEDLAEEDATKRSDAAREAFLAELALDSKKVTRGGNDNSKHMQEKSKERKRTKEPKKNKESKAETPLHLETNESSSFQVSYDGDMMNLEAPQPIEYSLISPDGNFEQNVQPDIGERKLNSVDSQMLAESEAELKHICNLQKKKSAHLLDECLPVFRSPSSFLRSQVTVETVQDKSDGNLHFMYAEPAKECAIPSKSTADGSHDAAHAQISITNRVLNSGRTGDKKLIYDRRMGRRGRKQKITTISTEMKYHPVSSEMTTLHFSEAEHNKVSATSSLSSQTTSSENNSGVKDGKNNHETVAKTDIFCLGLKNDVGEYNCFLNVIIQSLWHLKSFRGEFLKRSITEHIHVGDPCVICALYDVFVTLNSASSSTQGEAVAPTCLRIALSNLYPDSNFFQEAQMNDASEVLAVIFDCLHRGFTPSTSDSESPDGSYIGSWDCKNSSCIAHSLFGMDIFERMDCHSCGFESRHLKYTSFFHNINASALRTMKAMCAESSFDELLNLVEMNHQLACDPDGTGCGKPNYIHHFLSNVPLIFTTVMGWQNTCESPDDITATLAALSTKIDISVLYRGLDPMKFHSLVSVVCYYGEHYHCFAYSHEHNRWIMYDDKIVKVIGSWDDVLVACERGHLQPQVLFFEAEAVN